MGGSGVGLAFAGYVRFVPEVHVIDTLIDKADFPDCTVEVIRRTDTEPGVKVVRRRWVVERTFGWMTRWRRLVRDCEAYTDVSSGMMQLLEVLMLLQRVCQ
ncbi:hypothetical protein A6A40_19560 (plasmid) [Azospirillum humicireducens]|uniref:Transposase IS4-like domain-containing protein n=1 Tax=Azospirillum humicireducens TaxID=1226968 RepID=A0A2R4VS60_9PROT|nr:hypothetical protein A6A40_19560 [Azospirillum humicireducens]